MNILDHTNHFLGTSPAETLPKMKSLMESLSAADKEIEKLRTQLVAGAFDEQLANTETIEGIPVLRIMLPNADMEALREMADKFRQKNPSGVALLASDLDGKPVLLAVVTDDLVKRGLHAGNLVKQVAQVVGGGGGATLAQSGGKFADKLDAALQLTDEYIKDNLAS